MQFDAMMRIVESVYDAAVSGNGWHEILTDLSNLSGMENAALVIVDPQASLSSVTTPRADPDIVARYANFWWQKDVTAHATASKPVGLLTTLEDTGRELFFSSEFYNDFWRTSGLGAERVASNLFIDNGAFASFVLQASQRNDRIDTDTIRIFETLVPHMVRAASLQRTMYRLQFQRDLARAAGNRAGVGALLVDRHGQLLAADEDGDTLLTSCSDLKLEKGVIGLSTVDATNKLHTLIASCGNELLNGARGGILTPDPAPGSTPLRIEVVPYKPGTNGFDMYPFATSTPAALLLVTDPSYRSGAAREALQERYGLTPAETAFALEILKGDGRAAAANRLGISISTARTHLSRIFDKTGVNRQAELVRLLSDYAIDE